MSYQRVLKRSWQILWGYKVLWLFGFILALTTTSTFSVPPANNSENDSFTIDLGDREFFSASSIEEVEAELYNLGQQIDDGLLLEMREIFVAAGAIILVVFFWIAIATLFRYVAETALIKMVHKHEETGKKVSITKGVRLGWSRSTWRIFLIDLLVRFPIYIILLALFLLSLVPLLLWLTGSYAAGAVGIGLSVVMFIPLLVIALLVGAAVTLFSQFFRRVCVLEDRGVLASIGHGFSMVIENPKEVLVTGLIVLGISIVTVIAMVPIFVILLPVELLFILLGMVAAGLPAALIGGLGAILFGGPIPWILAGAVGLPILMLFIVAPFAFIKGLLEAYLSIIWTLTYRELKGLPALVEEKAPNVSKLKTAVVDIG